MFFTAKLKVQKFHIGTCSHTCLSFLIINITHHSGMFVKISEPILTRHYQYVRVHFWWCTFYEFGQTIRTCNHHYKSIFTALKLLCYHFRVTTEEGSVASDYKEVHFISLKDRL